MTKEEIIKEIQKVRVSANRKAKRSDRELYDIGFWNCCERILSFIDERPPEYMKGDLK